MFHWMWNIKREIQASEASIENLLLHYGSTNMKMNLFAWQSTKVEQLQQVKHKLGQPLQAAHEVQHFKHFTGNNENNSSTCTYTYVQHTNTCIYIHLNLHIQVDGPLAMPIQLNWQAAGTTNGGNPISRQRSYWS